MALFSHSGLELERLDDPGALGVPLRRQGLPLPVAARRLPVRRHLHPGHPALPAAPTVHPRRRYCRTWRLQEFELETGI